MEQRQWWIYRKKHIDPEARDPRPDTPQIRRIIIFIYFPFGLYHLGNSIQSIWIHINKKILRRNLSLERKWWFFTIQKKSEKIPGLGRSPRKENDTPLHYSCLENSMNRGGWQFSPWDCKESDTTEWLTSVHIQVQTLWLNFSKPGLCLGYVSHILHPSFDCLGSFHNHISSGTWVSFNSLPT